MTSVERFVNIGTQKCFSLRVCVCLCVCMVCVRVCACVCVLPPSQLSSMFVFAEWLLAVHKCDWVAWIPIWLFKPVSDLAWGPSALKRSDSMWVVLFTLLWKTQIWVPYEQKQIWVPYEQKQIWVAYEQKTNSDLGHFCLQCDRSLGVFKYPLFCNVYQSTHQQCPVACRLARWLL